MYCDAKYIEMEYSEIKELRQIQSLRNILIYNKKHQKLSFVLSEC